MSTDITGERVYEKKYRTTETGQNVYLMHIASYEFARKWCVGKRVLDLGCGTGYGTHQIAEDTTLMVGVDIDLESIDFAKREYKLPNLEYRHIGAGKPLQFEAESFDVILSFQVIEHVGDDFGYLTEAKRLLCTNGTIIVITPDRRNRLLSNQQPWNRWHLREYSQESIIELISEVFLIECILNMSAKKEIIERELSRYRINKYLLLPFTFPGTPYPVRKYLLTLVHKLIALRTFVEKSNTIIQRDRNIGIEDILFEKKSDLSLCLVCIGKKTNNVAS